MDKKIKDWGVIGFIIYCLSLPIMMWKSSKIGRILFVYLSILLCLFALNKVINPIYKAYVKFKVIKSVEPILKNLEDIKANIERQKAIVEEGEKDLKALVNAKQGEIREEVYNKIQKPLLDSLDKDTDDLHLIEMNIRLIKTEERETLKNMIYDIREKIKIQKKSIDEKDVRKLCEDITASTELLTKDEKERIWTNLEEIGFQVNKTHGNMVEVYGGNYSCVTATSVMFMPMQEVYIQDRRK